MAAVAVDVVRRIIIHVPYRDIVSKKNGRVKCIVISRDAMQNGNKEGLILNDKNRYRHGPSPRCASEAP